MPTYEYECKACGYRFDVFQNIKDDPLKVCPECGEEVRRLINGGMGIIFKGNGFYVTDKGGGAGKAEKKAGDGKPADAKPADGKTAESKTVESKALAACSSCAKSETCSRAV